MNSKWATLIVLPILFCASTKLPVAQTSPPAVSRPDLTHALTEPQKQAMKRIQAESEKKASAEAPKFAAIVSRIYQNMLADKPDEALGIRLSARMKEAAWKLLTIKGQAIRETVKVLTPSQKRLIMVEMRKPGAASDLLEVISVTFKVNAK